jgi:glutamate dehydrogenase
VVGEGGNLGATQAGRIEYALAGGHISTDFIDNAGGVDCSDHEVNIKILLNRVVDAGDLTVKQRNQLLQEMTDNVAGLVLRHNYQQTQCLSLVAAEGGRRYDDQVQMIRAMEKEGRLDRAIEGLPDDEQLAQREQLSRPEIAVLVCYAKLSLFDRLVGTDLQLDPFFADELQHYFPPPLQQRLGAEIPHHRLAREIIATVTANDLINRMGGTFVYRLHELTNADPVDITRAYLMARETFAAANLWQAIEALDNQVPAALQTRLLLDLSRLLERAVRRLLQQHLTAAPIKQRVDELRPGVGQVAELLPELLGGDSDHWYPRTVAALRRDGVPEALAPRIAQLGPLVAAIDIVQIAAATGRPIGLVCRVYFGLDDCLSLHWLHQQTTALPTGERWGKLARGALREELYQAQRLITADIITGGDGESDPDRVIRDWSKRHQAGIDQYHDRLAELQASDEVGLAMLSVAMRELRGLMEDSQA